ncbi:MAG: tRNA-dihydrouridine synthase [Candidatus Komeilibacteria bacterium]|nr:tRNA-dihydrouridine synthase [Candidatus Komeilibacteria bacterium]
MNYGFWSKLKKPIMVLAPMADVTDVAFREIIAKYGKPDVFWTEFVSAAGLDSVGRDKLLIDLQFSKKQRPIVAQFFSSKPSQMYKVAQLAAKLGFDGIDINMGCPDKSIEKQGAGAALMKNPALAAEIILATKEGAGKLPVSVKTRLGYNTNVLDQWLVALLKAEPAVIIIHARTRKQMSKVPAQWSEVARAVTLTKELTDSKNRPLIFGNGDVTSLIQAKELAKQTGADGVMIGRGIFGNPWFFNPKKSLTSISLEERFGVMLEHTFLFAKLLGQYKNFDIMKKHFKAYVSGFDGAKELRVKLMAAKTAQQVMAIIVKNYPKVKIPKI